jgi:hypothetical protein
VHLRHQLHKQDQQQQLLLLLFQAGSAVGMRPAVGVAAGDQQAAAAGNSQRLIRLTIHVQAVGVA